MNSGVAKTFNELYPEAFERYVSDIYQGIGLGGGDWSVIESCIISAQSEAMIYPKKFVQFVLFNKICVIIQSSKFKRSFKMNITYKVIVDEDGTQEWYLDDKRHRVDGPAVICADGDQYWYLNGKYHRVDGPAVICADGDQYWYLDGVKMSQEEHAARTAPVKELTVAEIESLLGYKVKIVK